VIRMVRVALLSLNQYSNTINCKIVIAAQSIANIVKSSLGPLGLDKMLVDNIGVSFVSDNTVNIVRSVKITGSNNLQ
jgi:chaperonin GroEL (HSP60 family)